MGGYRGTPMRRRYRLGQRPIMTSPYLKSVLMDGLNYVRANICPWAGMFMSVTTKDKRVGRLIGFVLNSKTYRALVMIGKTSYVFDLDQIAWPQDDPLKNARLQIQKIMEQNHGR